MNGLIVHPNNTRYFKDSTGKLVYLTGAHNWSDFQDYGVGDPPPTFDYDAYMDYLVAFGHNATILWQVERTQSGTTWATPHPWNRTCEAPNALDGKARFDLTSWNTTGYFDRLASRVSTANSHGIYAIIMLWNFLNTGAVPWHGHPLNASNNCSSIDGDPDAHDDGRDTHRLQVTAIHDLQVAYLHKVIDAVNQYDNVIYLISNEDDSTLADNDDWQNHMIDDIISYEATKDKQHPIIFSTQLPEVWATMTSSNAQAMSPNLGSYDFEDDPPDVDGTKVMVVDTDHTATTPTSTLNPAWPWKILTTGSMPLQMDWYNSSETLFPRWSPAATEEMINYQMGYTLTYANKMGLVNMVPDGTINTAGYALKNAGIEYLFYQPVGYGVYEKFTNRQGDSYIENRKGWETTTRGYDDKSDKNSKIALSNSELQLLTATDQFIVNLFTSWTPPDTNYWASAAVKVATGTGSRLVYSPVVRGVWNTTGLDGYFLRIDAVANTAQLHKCVDGTATGIGSTYDTTGIDFSTYQILKIQVTGTTTTHVTAWIGDTQVCDYDDSSSPLTAVGNAGIGMIKFTDAPSSYLDDFKAKTLTVTTFDITLPATKTYNYEWFNPWTGAVASSGSASFSSGTQTPPFAGDAVLWLSSPGIGEKGFRGLNRGISRGAV